MITNSEYMDLIEKHQALQELVLEWALILDTTAKEGGHKELYEQSQAVVGSMLSNLTK